MKGSTHATVGIAAAGILAHPSVSTLLSNPAAALPFAAAYIGSLICDMDIGNSTISNGLVPIKGFQFRKLFYIAYFILGAAVLIYFKNTKYFIAVAAAVIIGGLSFNSISQGVYRIVRKVLLVGVAVVLMMAGVVYRQYPLIAAGAATGALMFSPHRGYSHSLLSTAACYFIVKYACNWYRLHDISIYFAAGMISHLITDMLTDKGITLLFPYPKKFRFPLTITTGSYFEYAVSAAAVCCLALASGVLKF